MYLSGPTHQNSDKQKEGRKRQKPRFYIHELLLILIFNNNLPQTLE